MLGPPPKTYVYEEWHAPELAAEDDCKSKRHQCRNELVSKGLSESSICIPRLLSTCSCQALSEQKY